MKLFSLLLTIIQARPDGSPTCQINTDKITAGMGPQQDLGFQALMKKRSPTTFSVEITSLKNVTSYNGILMYVTSKNESIHYGKFNFERVVVKDKFKFQNSCGNENIVGAAESTVTHGNGNPVNLTGLFMLELSEEELKIPDLVLKTVIAGGEGSNEPPAQTTSAQPQPTPNTVGKIQLPRGHPTIGNSLVRGHPALAARFVAAKIQLPNGHPNLDDLAKNGATLPNNHPPLSDFYQAATTLRKRQLDAKVGWQQLKDVVITGPGEKKEEIKNTTSNALGYKFATAVVLSILTTL